MGHPKGATWLGVALLAVCVLLAGCAAPWASATTGQRQATAATPTNTATTRPPTVPPIHTLSLGGYKAAGALPGAAGLVLYPAVSRTTPEPLPSSGAPSLAFYSYATAQVEQIVAAPDADSGIVSATYAGDWVTYVIASRGTDRWQLWAYNVTTRERVQVASSADGYGWYNGAPQIASATDVVWTAPYPTAGSTLAMTRLLDYSFATRQSTTLYTAIAHTITPVALNKRDILLAMGDAKYNLTSTWLLHRGASAPKQISSQVADGGEMTAQYAVWSVFTGYTGSTTLYDLTTSSEHDALAPCVNPALFAQQPYFVCLSPADRSLSLVHLPDGSKTMFTSVQKHNFGPGVYGNRVVWVDSASTDVDYFDLPSH